MIPHKIFSYWEGIKPDYIQYCLRSLTVRTQGSLILDPSNINKYMSIINPNWRRITWLAQKVDIIRLAVLYQEGGLWADADTIWLKDPGELFDRKGDFYASKWTSSGHIINGYFFAQKESKFIGHCIDFVNKTLKEDPRSSYPQHGGVFMGEHTFKQAHEKDPELLCEIPTSYFLPFELPYNKQRWWSPLKITKMLKPETVAIGLNHSQYPQDKVYTLVREHMNQNHLFGDCFRYSEGVGSLF